MKSKRASTTSKTAARSWIEANFQKRECIKFIPSPRDEHRCCCGQSLAFHCGKGVDVGRRPDPNGSVPVDDPPLIWSPSRHTQPSPTDAYGTIEFQGGPHPSKAQYVRLAYDTRPELILQLFTREWGLELPKLLITVQGGKANFDLQPKLKKVLRKGLLKAAKTTGAWIFTGGTNTGVTRQVGDALLLERSQRSGRVISIGIAPWGIVENNHELLGHNRDVPYHSISSPRSKYAVLNNRHAYFLLVDNGSGGRYGAEIILRRKLEKYISNQKLHPCTHCSTPVVCLVIEGGTNTIRAVLEYVTDTPPVPVVVCDGSGRAADLLAFSHKYATDSGEQTVLESMKDYLVGTIQRTFEVGLEQAEMLYHELVQCTRNKNLITVFRITDRPEEKTQELDQTILTALFKSQHLSPSEQLSLALAWNRVDIARSEIFVYGQEWPPGALDEAMMQALEHDRIDFVKLLLENGVSMRKFLTIPRLEELYNTKQGPTNTLGYILLDVRPHIPRGYQYTLHDIGLVINKLMGGAYRAHYTRRKFRVIYAKVMKKSPHVHRNSSSFIRYYGNANFTLSLLAEALPASSREMPLFDYPFNELLIWAVLTKRQQMALLMWQHGEEALAKALVACKLYKAMAHEAAEDDLETEIYEELRNYGKEFENIALDLLDFCYRQDDDQTQQLLTCELQNWSGQTCLSLAVAGNHRALLAHPCSQIILADLWMGGLRTRKNTNLKVVLGLLCPVYIVQLDFKSKEELQLMPQTEEEHMIGLEEENDSLDVKPSSEHSEMTHRNTEPDAEKWPRGFSIKNKSPSQQGVKALINQEHYNIRDTIVQENGKVITDDMDQLFHLPLDYFDAKANRPLRLKKKLYEFYTAPITKFWGHSIAYILFLCLFSYVVLVRMHAVPSWQELYTIAYICTLGCEKIREIVSSEPVAISHKFAVWAWNTWNPCDASAIVFFLIGMVLRLKPSSMSVGRVIYCVDIIYWYLRILHILGVNKYLGPLVTMMGKMIKNMIYFVVLLLVVLMSFGVCRQAILFPNNDPDWILAKEVFFQPYFMLYGEVFADYIDPPCGDGPNQQPCQTGRWITPAVMSTYLLVANILLINLLIAVFNNIFNEVNAVSHQVWMFQRFTVVMEYEQKPVLPPPLIIFCHIYLLVKFCRRKVKGVEETYDNGLKLFLDSVDLERLHDFEEECVEGYFREKETRLQLSTEERIKATNERVENMQQKIEDIDQKENRQVESVQSLEYRLRNLEDLAEKTSSHLAVIHRFMATHLGDGGGGGGGGSSGGGGTGGAGGTSGAVNAIGGGDADAGSGGGGRSPSEDRIRRPEDDRLLMPGPPRPFRRPPTRSLTEVRPDWWPDAMAAGEHRHFRHPLLTASSIDEDTRKVEPLVEGENEEEEEEDSAATGGGPGASTGTLGVCGGGSGASLRGGKRPVSSQHGASKTSLQDSFWQAGGEGSGTKLSEGAAERSDEVDGGSHVDRTEEALNLEDEDGIQLDFSSHLYERRMQQQAREAKRRRSSCDTEDDSQAPSSTSQQPPHVPSRGGKAAHGGFPRRQLSQTQSEPDMEERRSVSSSVGHNAPGGGIGGASSLAPGGLGARVTWAEPKIQVFPAPPRSMLLAMHAEYTSITDELETVCSLLSPPRTPRLLSPPRPHLNRKSDSAMLASSREHIGIPRSVSRTRHISEMSNPEMAIHMERENLRDAEEIDYQLMEGVIQRRFARQRHEDNDGMDKSSSADDDLGSSSDDPTELHFVAPPTRQQRLQQAYRTRSQSVGPGSVSGSTSVAFLTVTNEAPEYRCPPRLRRSSAVEMNEHADAQRKRDSSGTDEGGCVASEHSSTEVHVARAGPSQPTAGGSGITSQCPQIFCTDADADGSEKLVPPRQRRPSISAIDDATKINVVTESLC